MSKAKENIKTQLITIFENANDRNGLSNCPHDRCPYLESNIDCAECNAIEDLVDFIADKDLNIDLLKSTITHKEEEAYNKGYEDAKADILEKLQADIARDEILAEYGDELFEGRIAGFKAVINYILSEDEE